jgi:N-acetylglucosamine kinase-like BadF-type ATPase
LFDRLEHTLRFHSRLDLVSRVGDMNRSSIASLAELVDQSATEGDEPATVICASAATHLAEIVAAVIDQLTLPTGEFALVVTGGVLLNRTMVSHLLLERLPLVGLTPTSIDRCDDPAWGAVRIARSMQQT